MPYREVFFCVLPAPLEKPLRFDPTFAFWGQVLCDSTPPLRSMPTLLCGCTAPFATPPQDALHSDRTLLERVFLAKDVQYLLRYKYVTKDCESLTEVYKAKEPSPAT